MFKQYVVARKDLHMSAGKLSAQVSHASMCFLTNMMDKNISENEDGDMHVDMVIPHSLWNQWLSPQTSFTKVVLEAKNLNALNRLIQKLEKDGFEEGKDFFVIHDNARTELQDYIEEDGRVTTCIGFTPCNEEKLQPYLKKFQLYKG